MSLAVLRRRLEQGLEGFCLALLATLAAVVIVGVAFRKAGAALVWYDEVASILLAWLTYYGAAYAALKRAHISFPKLVANLDGPARIALALVREGVVLSFLAVLTWAGWEVLLVLDGIYLTSLPGIPVRFAQSVMPISAVVFIVAELLSFAAVWQSLCADGRSA